MRSLTRRIEQLEQRKYSTESEIHFFVINAGATFALKLDECFAILSETGFVRHMGGIKIFDFLHVPHGFDTRSLADHLRNSAHKICNIGGTASG